MAQTFAFSLFPEVSVALFMLQYSVRVCICISFSLFVIFISSDHNKHLNFFKILFSDNDLRFIFKISDFYVISRKNFRNLLLIYISLKSSIFFVCVCQGS